MIHITTTQASICIHKRSPEESCDFKEALKEEMSIKELHMNKSDTLFDIMH